MKTKVTSLLVVMILATISCMAQKRITVEVPTDDISKNLDLKAVATAFGESKDLEEFEQRLNDNESHISNLDLNNDGEVDYLRVIEDNKNATHNILIQAVIGKDNYQDVATILVERNSNNKTTVEIVGDQNLYGENNVIEPVYLYTPSIFSYLWTPGYYSWYSPYYWGYYPSYFHHRRSLELGMYLSHIYNHFGHANRYYANNNVRRNYSALGVRNSVRQYNYGSNTYMNRVQSFRSPNRSFGFNHGGGNHSRSRR